MERHERHQVGPTPARALRGGALPVLATVLLAGLMLSATNSASAGHIPFPNQRVAYDLQHETLKGFLQRFFDDMGLPVVISAQVQEEPGTLNGPRSGTAAEVFKSIADSNSLVGYYDGSVAYIYKGRELSGRYFQIDPARIDAFKQATVGFGLTDPSDSLQVTADTGLVSASGTPRFLEQLTQLSTALGHRSHLPAPAAPQAPLPRMTLRFLPLKYAWAADTTFSVGNQRTVVPGVATLLRQLLSQSDSGSNATLGGPAVNSAAATGLRGKGLAALGDRLAQLSVGTSQSGTTAGATSSTYGPAHGLTATEPAAAAGDSVQSTPTSASAVSAMLDGTETPRIVADPYRNAVIIRDYPDRMPLYEDLVQQLDVENQIIQLDATVIDIDETRARQLGIDWAYQHGNTTVAFGGGIHPVDAAGKLAGLELNTIISDTSAFLARVNALEQQGVTNIVQRPQVITLNDVEAVIESTQSVYIPVSGAFDEDLYGVAAGTVLRVTPHLIDDHGRKRIRLLVTVEDGNVQVTSQQVQTGAGQNATQAVPIVTRNAVNTQAIIDAGQGLLLGGLVRKESSRSANQVPVLGSIPLFGRLFRGETVRHENTERLFLISPQLIIASVASPPAP